jgi:hypothetical protein
MVPETGTRPKSAEMCENLVLNRQGSEAEKACKYVAGFFALERTLI